MTNSQFIEAFLNADEQTQLAMAQSLNSEHPTDVFSLLLARNKYGDADHEYGWAQFDADFITRDEPDYPLILRKLKSWFSPAE